MQQPPSDQGPGAAIAGSWEVRVRPDGIEPGFVNLSTFLPGGGLINSVSGQTGHGSWSWVGGDAYALTLIFSELDEVGQETSRSTVMATLTLAADGDRFAGPYVNVLPMEGQESTPSAWREQPMAGAFVSSRCPRVEPCSA